MEDDEFHQSIFLRIIFRNEDAAYYQFHVFPNVDSSQEVRLARLRNGDSQYIEVFFRNPVQLEAFVQGLHVNPHVAGVIEITAEDFRSKRSEAV